MMRLTEKEELQELKAHRARLIWFTKEYDTDTARRIRDTDRRIKELEKKTRMQT